jgi:hypothetical protein
MEPLMRLIRRLGLALAAAFLLSTPSSLVGSAVSSDAILTVSGSHPAAVTVDLDLAALEQMPHHTIATSTPWTEGVSSYEGVLLRDLLRQLGVSGATIKLTALNDYAITIAAADFDKYDVVLAYARDGQAMPVRDKGPLWVVYPLDDHPELNNEDTHAKMIWQVRRLEVE